MSNTGERRGNDCVRVAGSQDHEVRYGENDGAYNGESAIAARRSNVSLRRTLKELRMADNKTRNIFVTGLKNAHAMEN
jgi:hypothetical protein